MNKLLKHLSISIIIVSNTSCISYIARDTYEYKEPYPGLAYYKEINSVWTSTSQMKEMYDFNAFLFIPAIAAFVISTADFPLSLIADTILYPWDKDRMEVCDLRLFKLIEKYEWSSYDELGHSSFSAPAAVFKVFKPEKYKNKEVKIVLRSKEYEELKMNMKHHTSDTYQIMFPSDFFSGAANTIMIEDVVISKP